MAIAHPDIAGPGAETGAEPATSQQSGHQNSLDGLRVIAAAAVLLANVGGATGLAFSGSPASWITTRGDIGVAVFFALSGYLLYRPWAVAALAEQSRPEVRRYAVRRVLRILPAYWIVVVVALVAWNHAHIRSAWTWIQYLLLLQNYDGHPWWSGTGAVGLGQMWSLVVDASFYALLPLLAALLSWLACRRNSTLRGRARTLLAGVGVAGLASYGFAVLAYRPGSAVPWLGVTLPVLMSWFAAGMAIAVVSAWAHAEPGADGPVRTFARTVAVCWVPCLLIAGLLFVIACTPVAGPEAFGIPTLWNAEVKTALYTLIAAAVVAPAAFGPLAETRLSGLLGNRVMRFLGKISYGIFLWQGVVIVEIFARMHLHSAIGGGSYGILVTAGVLGLAACVTTVLAVLSHYLIERPALSRSARDTHRA